ncbi:MAG: CBS domain-containing protein [Myxococcaceae bacterium]
MTKSTVPTIRKFMTTQPITLQVNAKLAEAQKVMKDNHIRHVPICEGDKIVGMVTDGDLHRAQAISGVDSGKTAMRDVMAIKPYTVSPDAPVDEVVREMATRKFGSAVVVDNGHVVGVFTTVDAMSAFAEFLEQRR